MRADPTILIVDDDPLWLQTLADYLRQHHFWVRVAGDCRSALAEVQRQPVELILLDFHMPDGDGRTLLDRLRVEGIHTPVLLLSSDNDPRLLDRAEVAGATAFLTKTTSPRLLLRTVHAVLGRETTQAPEETAGQHELPHANLPRRASPVAVGRRLTPLSGTCDCTWPARPENPWPPLPT